MPLFLLSDEIIFPSPHLAGKEGLLAAGGDLTEKRLLCAYEKGIFPWYSEGDPILWWSPDPRLVLYPEEFKISRSLKRIIKKRIFRVTVDTAFKRVIRSCADVPRGNNAGTWIVEEMIDAYCRLHESGYAHSVEAWYGDDLAGGLYGVSLGGCFFGESMFSRVDNASKAAFAALVEYLKSSGCSIIDCQVTAQHLMRFGAREIPRTLFLKELEEALKLPAGFLLKSTN